MRDVPSGGAAGKTSGVGAWVGVGVGFVIVAGIALAVYVFTRPEPAGVAPAPQSPVEHTQSIGPAWFRDLTADSGIDFTYRNSEERGKFTILESLGGGVGLLDYDGDGLLDVFLTGGGYYGGEKEDQLRGFPCKLYRNLGNWKYEEVTAKVGLDSVAWWYTHGVAVGDYDRDGWPDLLVTGFDRVALFRNTANAPGGRKFVDVTATLGLKCDAWCTSAGWGDLDGDGFPELYVCRYADWSMSNDPPCYLPGDQSKRDICPPPRFSPLRHYLFRNERGGGLRDISDACGFRSRGRGLGVIWADLNEDSRPDIYVANDMNLNFLFMNRAGKLEETAELLGVAGNDRGIPDGSMGVDVGDYDGSGRASIWVTNYQGEAHALYRNVKREAFSHQSRSAGVTAIGQSYVGFGTGFVDIDNDGWEDLLIANGHVMRNPVLGSPIKQRPVILQNIEHESRRFYKDVSSRGGPFFATPALGRGLSIGDLDNDGWPDVVVSHSNTPVALLRNVAGESMAAGWVGVKLVGNDHRDVAGSTVTLQTETRTLTRFAKGGGSYLSAPDTRLLFGLGAKGTIGRVTVRWAWGETQSWDAITPGAYWELREGEAAARRLTPPR